MRAYALFFAVLAGGCATALTSQGARVSVYQASLDAPEKNREMPESCRLLDKKATVSMTESEMQGQHDPYRKIRNEVGGAGANALLVNSRVTIGRRNFECPSASPITDCPGSSGAWLDVVFESYSCTAEALHELDARGERAPARP